jgi:site-specific recombinase XerC
MPMALSFSPGVFQQAMTTVLDQHNIQKRYHRVCHDDIQMCSWNVEDHALMHSFRIHVMKQRQLIKLQVSA